MTSPGAYQDNVTALPSRPPRGGVHHQPPAAR